MNVLKKTAPEPQGRASSVSPDCREQTGHQTIPKYPQDGPAMVQMMGFQQMADLSPKMLEVNSLQRMAEANAWQNPFSPAGMSESTDTVQMMNESGDGVLQATFEDVFMAAQRNHQGDLRDFTKSQKELMRQVVYIFGNLEYLFQSFRAETREHRAIGINAKKMQKSFDELFAETSPGVLRVPEDTNESARREEECQELLAAGRELFERFEELIESTRQERPHKKFDRFMGDKSRYRYHSGRNAADAIPAIWYKSVDDYDPIVTSTGSYAYPNGPDVQGNRGSYSIKVQNVTEPKIGQVFLRKKTVNTRNVQADINVGLINAGVNMNGLDGDHVQDLGFEGRDVENNYWPLNRSINQRPFHGWSGLYGINVLNPNTGEGETKVIDDLYGRYFKIVDVMDAKQDPVPQIGKRPDERSGAD